MAFISHLPEALSELDSKYRMANEQIGGMAVGYAAARAPKDTGRLMGSIDHGQENNYRTVVVGTNVQYAPYVELGHHQEPGRYVPAIGKRLKRSFVPGIPFLRPSIEDHVSEYINVLRTILSE